MNQIANISQLKVDLLDQYDAVCLAKTDLDWTLYAFQEIKEKVKALKEQADQHQMYSACFQQLEHFTSILEITMTVRANYWENEEKKIYQQLVENGGLSNAN